ncbi:LysR family transcriptional regulator [Streptomyces sp. NPDC092296]|uniref:LysR family transcriptional regulator n=1 Tax=Streptomyces sp. NPDC092296 TaxID=3366012 RepID=UPI00382A93E1
MELQHLRSFLEVSSELSFTRAARKLHYAQSSVTAQIQQLEESLGTLLFDRQGRTISLTEGGRRLQPVAERIVALADLARQEVAGAGSRPPAPRARGRRPLPEARSLSGPPPQAVLPARAAARPSSTSPV